MTIFTRMLLGATAGALAFASPAHAQTWQVGNDSYHIYFTGLDLTKPTGRAEALRRIDRAAAKACADQVRRHECARLTTAESVAKTRNPWLARALAEREPISPVRMAAR